MQKTRMCRRHATESQTICREAFVAGERPVFLALSFSWPVATYSYSRFGSAIAGLQRKS